MGYLLESTSFYQKLSKNKSAHILLVVILISSIIAGTILNNYIISEFYPDYHVEAIEIDEKPIEYIPYIILEPYGIQSIFTSNISLKISYNVFIGINELMENYPNDVVEYDNQYYKLRYDFHVDDTNRNEHFGFALILVSFVSSILFIISVLLLMLILVIKIANYFNKT